MFYAVVLAGGGGTRFWPKSRKTRPKQLLDIIGEGPLISQTLKRLEGLFSREKILVLTQENQVEELKEHIDLPEENILAEPQAKNTAAAIGLAALELKRRAGEEAVFAVLPSDHYIADLDAFLKALLLAKEVALQGYLVTIGIRPRYPETGYGYIGLGKRLDEIGYQEVHLVERFVEKPDLPTATRFVEQGNHLWNSGTFVWKVQAFMEAIRRHLPALYEGLEEIARSGYHSEVIRRIYNEFPDVSIDYGLMEKADPGEVAVVIGEYGWSDVGSWSALGELLEKDEQGNVMRGEVVGLDCSNSILYGDGGLIGAIGLEEMIVVFSGGAVLVCPKERAQDVRSLVERLKELGEEEHL
jgi:mannose-1-phosphate guanylyltransferase